MHVSYVLADGIEFQHETPSTEKAKRANCTTPAGEAEAQPTGTQLEVAKATCSTTSWALNRPRNSLTSRR